MRGFRDLMEGGGRKGSITSLSKPAKLQPVTPPSVPKVTLSDERSSAFFVINVDKDRLER